MRRYSLLLLLSAAACAQAAEPAAPADKTQERRERLQREHPRHLPERLQPADSAAQSEQIALPDELRETVLTDAAKRSGLGHSVLKITSARAVTWSDGALGCPQPGEFYTQLMVPGYHIIVRAGEKSYDYRVPHKGVLRLCEPRLERPGQR